MTKAQKLAIAKLLKNAASPSATMSEYEIQDGALKNTGQFSCREAARRLDSADYKLGWAECYKEFQRTLAWIQTASVQDLKKYSGSY